jgi:phage terminase small subunit
MKKLNSRQAAFVREYLVDLSPGQAALRAGYQRRGMYSQAAHLMGQPEVQAAIGEAMAERAKRTRITADRVLQELAAIAFSDIGAVCSWKQHDVTDEDPRKSDRRRYDTQLMVRDSEEIDPLARRAIARVRRYEGGAVRFEMHDKLGALNLLAKHLGLAAPKQVEVADTIGWRARTIYEEMGADLTDVFSKLTRAQRDRLRAAIKEIFEEAGMDPDRPVSELAKLPTRNPVS